MGRGDLIRVLGNLVLDRLGRILYDKCINTINTLDTQKTTRGYVKQSGVKRVAERRNHW